MDANIVKNYGPGMSFYLTQIKSFEKKRGKAKSSALADYCVALKGLYSTNKLLENRMNQLLSNCLGLNLDTAKLRRLIGAFHGEILETCQADTLTCLVEAIYRIHGWKMPGGLFAGEYDNLDRGTLSRTYTKAAKSIKKEMITKRAVGLSEKYYCALQRYSRIVHFRSTNPFRTECLFARWLLLKKTSHAGMYRFWERLFPLCYNRTVLESSEMF